MVLSASSCEVCGDACPWQQQKHTVLLHAYRSFLALDKCLKGRDYLQILQLGEVSLSNNPKSTDPVTIEHDIEWLTILQLTNDRLFDPQLIYKFENRKMAVIDKHLLDVFSEKFKETKEALTKSLSDKLAIPETLFK